MEVVDWLILLFGSSFSAGRRDSQDGSSKYFGKQPEACHFCLVFMANSVLKVILLQHETQPRPRHPKRAGWKHCTGLRV